MRQLKVLKSRYCVCHLINHNRRDILNGFVSKVQKIASDRRALIWVSLTSCMSEAFSSVGSAGSGSGRLGPVSTKKTGMSVRTGQSVTKTARTSEACSDQKRPHERTNMPVNEVLTLPTSSVRRAIHFPPVPPALTSNVHCGFVTCQIT